MLDRAGGRSQLASLTTSAVVLIVLLLLTGPLASLPVAALAAVVFLIAVDLIDVTGMRRILAVRQHEFAVALLTAAAVVILGVEDGIVLAVVASVIDHLRHSYHPRNSVLVKSPAGHWQPAPVVPGARTKEGLAVYRFGTSLYYANASRLLDDITALAAQGSPLRWIVLDGAAIGDVDYTAAAVLARVIQQLQSGTSGWSSAACCLRYASNSAATASTPPSAPAPTTTPPARRSRHSGSPDALAARPVPAQTRRLTLRRAERTPRTRPAGAFDPLTGSLIPGLAGPAAAKQTADSRQPARRPGIAYVAGVNQRSCAVGVPRCVPFICHPDRCRVRSAQASVRARDGGLEDVTGPARLRRAGRYGYQLLLAARRRCGRHPRVRPGGPG